MYTTRVSRPVNAPRPVLHRALVSAEAIARWRVPPGMRGEVHEFDAREGGRFRVSLTYDAPDRAGQVRRAHRRLPRPLREARAG